MQGTALICILQVHVWQFPDLSQIELATKKGKRWKLDYRTRLFETGKTLQTIKNTGTTEQYFSKNT